MLDCTHHELIHMHSLNIIVSDITIIIIISNNMNDQTSAWP